MPKVLPWSTENEMPLNRLHQTIIGRKRDLQVLDLEQEPLLLPSLPLVSGLVNDSSLPVGGMSLAASSQAHPPTLRGSDLV